MPESAASTLEARIAELVDERRSELEQLVHDRVDRLLGELVDRQLEWRNGNRVSAIPPPSTELCSRCGAEPRLADRTICTRCKSRDDVAGQAGRASLDRRSPSAVNELADSHDGDPSARSFEPCVGSYVADGDDVAGEQVENPREGAAAAHYRPDVSVIDGQLIHSADPD